MSFDPVAYTGEDGDEYKIFVRRKIRPGDKADKEPGLFGNVEIDWTEKNHSSFSGLLGFMNTQLEEDKTGEMYQYVCQNCGKDIVHKAVREWEIGHRYLGGIGEFCQDCVKQGTISSSMFPF